MKDLIWDATLSVEVDEIDEDHRRLVDLFNTLNHSVSDGDAPDYVEAVLEELINCTVWHFSHEERLMLKFGYKGYSDHKAEHQALLEAAEALRKKFLRQGKRISSEDIEHIERWLTGHVLGIDKDLGAYLAELM